MLIDKLRHETKPAHEELDKAMIPYIHNIHSKEDYSKLLAAFYGYFKPVYDKINTHLDTSFLPDYNSRRKPDDILQNLAALGHHHTIENTANHLPDVYNNASAFGALYVLEGSTLGGLMIKKMIASQTHLPDKKISFFAGYGKATRERWNTFVNALNNVAKTNEEEQNAIRAAAETFSFFKDWLHIVYF